VLRSPIVRSYGRSSFAQAVRGTTRQSSFVAALPKPITQAVSRKWLTELSHQVGQVTLPCRIGFKPDSSISVKSDTSAFSRSISDSAIRAVEPALPQKPVKDKRSKNPFCYTPLWSTVNQASRNNGYAGAIDIP